MLTSPLFDAVVEYFVDIVNMPNTRNQKGRAPRTPAAPEVEAAPAVEAASSPAEQVAAPAAEAVSPEGSKAA